MQTSSKFDIKRVNSDTNGNPRYVVHFLQLLAPEENASSILSWSGASYDLALQRASFIGGRKYSNNSYGGGIVFSTYGSLEREIEQAFVSFECSKDYTKAHDQLFLTIVNDAAMHNACLQIIENAFNPRTAWRNTVAELAYFAGTCADSAKLRCSANVKWLAAIMLAMHFEDLYKELRNKAK